MREHKFENVLGDLENTKIGLFLSDHQFVEGVLLAVKQDHIVIDVNQNVQYIARQHIKALSRNAKDFHVTSKTVPYLNLQHWTDVLSVMKYYMVTINGSGKQAHFGVLSQVAEDHIVLINHEELLYIPKFSIANIHSEISDNQISVINHQEQLASQKMHPAIASEAEEEMEIHQSEKAPDAILQSNIETKWLELSLEKETQAIQGEEGMGELQIDGNESSDQQDVPQQRDLVGAANFSYLDEEAERQADDSLQESHEPISSPSPDLTQESSNLLKEGILDNQDEEQIIEWKDLESVRMEEPLDGVGTELREESTFLTQDSPMLVVEDEEYTSEVSDQEELTSIFNDHKVELLSYSEPLGYERSFLLPDWKTFQKDLQEVTTINDQSEEEETPVLIDDSVHLIDSPEPIELWNAPICEHHVTQESKIEDQAELVGEEGPSANPSLVSITIRQMSPEEEKAMLEKQYFSLAKHAAGYSMKLEQHTDGLRSTFHPSFGQNKSGRRGNYTNFEKIGENPEPGIPEGKRAFEGQYVSLMNHAAKMYQQLRDI